MKLRVKEFKFDYWNEDVPYVCGQRELKRHIKKILSKARRNEEKYDIKDSIETN